VPQHLLMAEIIEFLRRHSRNDIRDDEVQHMSR
jgi:hypothetical protein